MNVIDWGKLRDFLEALVIVWGFISGGIVLWLRGQFVTRKTFDDTVKRLDTAIADCNAGSKAETNALALALSALNGTLGRLDEREVGMKDALGKLGFAVQRIESFLLNGRAA
jgi:hypothetical protein